MAYDVVREDRRRNKGGHCGDFLAELELSSGYTRVTKERRIYSTRNWKVKKSFTVKVIP